MSRAAIFLFLIFFASNTLATTRVAVYIGEAKAHASGETNKLTVGQIFEKPIYTFNNSELQWAIDGSYWHWENDFGDDFNGGAITPTLYYQHHFFNVDISYRFGVGLAYIEETQWHTRDLGDNWLFENKLEFGLHFTNKHSVLATICHYSNADLNRNNAGLDIISIGYQYQF